MSPVSYRQRARRSFATFDERVGAHPFSEEVESRTWRELIEVWFATLAPAVFQTVPFAHGVTGIEVSGEQEFEGRLGAFRRGLAKA